MPDDRQARVNAMKMFHDLNDKLALSAPFRRVHPKRRYRARTPKR
jgi:hypothetical protein